MAHNGYGLRPGAASTARHGPEDANALPPVAVWCPDGSGVAVHRLDETAVGEFHLVEHLPGSAGRRTALRSYRHPLAGEDDLPAAELWIIDVEDGPPNAG